jgi:hypothetical protein
LDQPGAVVAQGAFAEVGIVVAADVQGVLPAQVQGHGFDGLGIGQVVQLLEDEGTDGRIKVLAGPAEGASEVRCELGDGQMLQQIRTEDAGPGTLKELAAFVAKEGQGSKRSAV